MIKDLKIVLKESEAREIIAEYISEKVNVQVDPKKVMWLLKPSDNEFHVAMSEVHIYF